MTPNEVIAGPYEIWLAVVGSTFPRVDVAPSSPWALLGVSGDENYDEEGVTVTHSQTLNPWRSAGAAAARKVFRSAEELSIKVKLVDLSPSTYAKVLNNATVTVTPPGASQAGESSFLLEQGLTVATFALLAKGMSPGGDAYSAQYEAPIVYQHGNPTPVFVKGAPAGLECIFMALRDDTVGFGRLRVQTAAAS